MTNPQKQVSCRRLPPLPRTKPVIVHGARPTRVTWHSSSHVHDDDNDESTETVARDIDLSQSFMQGPFRPALQNVRFTSAKAPAQNAQLAKSGMSIYDSHTFLQDLSCMDPEIIFTFLKNSPSIMNEFIRDFISRDQLEIWLDMKTFQQFQERLSLEHFEGCGLPPSSKWKNTSSLERQHFMEDFINEVHTMNGDVRGGILHQLVDCCASAVNASGSTLYMADIDGKHIWQFIPESTNPINLQAVKEGSTIACYVATTKDVVSHTFADEPDDRFPQGLGLPGSAGCVLAMPILNPSGDLCGVIELVRVLGAQVFTEKDTQIVSSYLAWGGIVVHYAEMYHTMHKQRKLNEFLLNVTKSIFQDIISMDTVIMKIMNFAQTLVEADRTSLFLVDHKTSELYARIFDIGTGPETKLHKEIRFPKSKGVAGHVATTGETLNIKKAYEDPRFNRDIDMQTGYTTRTLLCMPIFIRGNLIGVVQMVNKRNGVFTPADEKAFQTFAVYCGLALHHAKLYDKIRRSEQKYKVALEVLSYHSMCTENEVELVRNCDASSHFESIERFEFNAFEVESIEMAHLAIRLFQDLFKEDSRFDPDELTRFTLTVRRNYRRVPYHNWTHAFTVAHCMYCCIKSSGGLIGGLEAVALYVACLCHDLDHRGKNNDWMKTKGTPLAAVYTTSTLEHHHFNQTITILQNEGHNIFSHLNSTEYKKVLSTIRDCILSTDLAMFFGNKAKLNEIVDGGTFDWMNGDHRRLVRALAMTACDLSACSKPWKVQYETVKVIFQEFYAQGDEEKALGRTPVPMMDRDTADKLPNHQVGFLVGICIPCYDLLQRLIPGTKPLLDGSKKNLAIWSEMVKKQNDEKEKQKHAFDNDLVQNKGEEKLAEDEVQKQNVKNSSIETSSSLSDNSSPSSALGGKEKALSNAAKKFKPAHQSGSPGKE